jgi:ribokinase
MVEVICVGSATWDIFLRSDEFSLGRLRAGKIEAQELVMASGGGATNAAVSYARKGIKAAAVVEMGKDAAAEMIVADLAKEGVDTSWVVQEEREVTAVSVILVSGKGSSIVTYRGASRMLTVADIPWARLEREVKVGGWIHLTSVGGDMELVNRLIAWAKEKQRQVYWNPGLGEKRPDQWPDVLQMNRSEASKFFGIDWNDAGVWRGEHCPVAPGMMLVITDGERGGRVCRGGKCWWYAAIKTPVLDSTGAGDAFGSGVVAALIKGKNTLEAIEWGKKQAASVVGQVGAKAGLLWPESL